MSDRKEEDVKEQGRKRNKSPRAKQFLGRSGRWLFSLLVLMQNWFCVDAAAGDWCQKGKRKCREIIIVSDAAEGTLVDLYGKKHSGGAQGKSSEKVEAVIRS